VGGLKNKVWLDTSQTFAIGRFRSSVVRPRAIENLAGLITIATVCFLAVLLEFALEPGPSFLDPASKSAEIEVGG
jgi:hypothetical protein